MEKLRRNGFSFILFAFICFFVLLVYYNSTPIFAQQRDSGFKWPPNLTIRTGGVGGAPHSVTVAWTPIMEQMTGVKMRVRPENNQVAGLKWLKSGTVDMEMNAVTETVYGIEAEGGYAIKELGPFQIGIVWLGQLINYGFIVRADSGIKTVYDIKPGHRIAIFSGAQGAILAMDALLAWGKVDKKDVVIVPYASFGSNIMSIPEGKADVAYATATSAQVIEAESNPHGVRWLPLPYKTDPEGLKRYSAIRPTHQFGICKTGAKSAIGVPMIAIPFYLYARGEVSPDLTYNIAKWLHENFNSYKDKHPGCQLMNIQDFREGLDCNFIPVHEGTIRYLKEIKMWTTKDDARQKYNVDLITKYEKAYGIAIAKAEQNKIDIHPNNTQWIELWKSMKKDLPSFKLLFEVPPK